MRQLFSAIVFFGLFVPGACFAGDSTIAIDSTIIEYSRLGEKIRQGQVDVGNEYSLKAKSGRFHRIHADELLLDCSHCHGKMRYKKDYQSFMKHQSLYPTNSKGRIEKSVCIGCHQQGAMGFPLYQGSTE